MNNVHQRLVCSKADCTAATTGICLAGKNSPQECEYCLPVVTGQTEGNESEKAETLQDGRSFHTGAELGTSDTLQVSSGSYTHVVGLMGPYNAGKTCFLLSLYLMASRQLLPEGYLFRRSLTLQGFEDRARKLREWQGGQLPEEFADHTSLADERRPGFLHLGIAKNDEQIDLLLSDLPGEWTTSLINHAETAKRWEFLKRADGIIVVLDGVELMGSNRFVHMTNAKHLLHRLKDTLLIPIDIPFVILVSKADEIQMENPAVLGEITQSAIHLGFAPKVILCASFSRTPHVVANGVGVFDALEHIITGTSQESYINWGGSGQNSSTRRPFRLFKSLR
ncbi:MAG: hypothetical protein ABIK28_14655 [Planctomycetota bacterium]